LIQIVVVAHHKRQKVRKHMSGLCVLCWLNKQYYVFATAPVWIEQCLNTVYY